jgi:hypothetical protein
MITVKYNIYIYLQSSRILVLPFRFLFPFIFGLIFNSEIVSLMTMSFVDHLIHDTFPYGISIEIKSFD